MRQPVCSHPRDDALERSSCFCRRMKPAMWGTVKATRPCSGAQFSKLLSHVAMHSCVEIPDTWSQKAIDGVAPVLRAGVVASSLGPGGAAANVGRRAAWCRVGA